MPTPQKSNVKLLPNGEFTLFIGGKERRGKLSLGGVCRVEAELGPNVSLISLLSKTKQNGWSFNVACAVLTVGLQTFNPSATREYVELWFQNYIDDGGNFDEYIAASLKIAMASLGKKVREGAEQAANASSIVLPNIDGDEIQNDDKDQGERAPLAAIASSPSAS